MDSFQKEAVRSAVEGLFKCKYFSICTVDAIGKAIGINPSHHPDYKFLRLLHCKDYADMSPEVINGLEQKVLNVFSAPRFNPALISDLITMEGRDNAFTEDRYVDAPPGNQKKGLLSWKKS